MENTEFYILAILIAALLVTNFIASYLVLTAYFEVKKRRLYQILFIWFVPLLGGIMAIYIHRESQNTPKPKRQVGNNSDTMPF